MTKEFQLYEIVTVNPSLADQGHLIDKEGHIISIYDRADGSIYYRVKFYPTQEERERFTNSEWSCDIEHDHLKSTGKIGREEDHFPGDQLRVCPDGSVVRDD